MGDPIIISYFTKGTLYEKEAERLRASCEKFSLEYLIEGIDPFGKWHQHVCYKPTFILQKMKELKRPLVWIDADAEIVQKPFFHFDSDIAIRLFEMYPCDHPCYAYAATIYFNYNPATLSLVKKWAKGCETAVRDGAMAMDQQILGPLLKKVKVSLLPVGYAATFEEKVDELFIVQYQASRLYKKIIDGEVAFGFFDHLSVDELRELRPKVAIDAHQ